MTEEAPSWIRCQDLLIRIKEELALEAIEALHREVEAKRLDFRGEVVTQEEENEEYKKDMLMIANLMESGDEIAEKYEAFIHEKEVNPQSLDAYTVSRIEELKKFLLSLGQIRYLMGMAYEIDLWMVDAGVPNGPSNLKELLYHTAKGHPKREEALKYAASSKEFAKANLLSNEEMEILKSLNL